MKVPQAAKIALFTILAGSANAVLVTSVPASLLMEDAFDYSVGALHGANGGLGWNNAWDYADNAGVTGDGTVEDGSLAFSNYPTTGNRARLANTGSSNSGSVERQYNRLSRASGVDILSGDLWIAFLFQRVDENGASDAWAELRNNNCFCLGITAKTGTEYFGNSANGLGIANRYDNVPSTPDGSTNIHDGNTYLMVGRFTEVNTTSATRTGTIWALSEADYDAIKAGGITAAKLDANHQLMSVDSDPGALPSRILLNHTMRFVNGVNFRGENLDIYDPFIFDFDELRYGDLLEDVVLVPTGISGDHNGDGKVDAADYALWRSDPGSYGGAQGYTDWVDNFGAMVGSSARGALGTAVPEPANFVFALMGLIFCFAGFRMRLVNVG